MNGGIVPGQWYDVKIGIPGNKVKGYLEGKLITFQIALNNLDKFPCLGGFSGFAPFNPETDIKTVYNGVFSDSIVFNKKVHPFFSGIGSEEGTRMKGLSDALTKAGIHNICYVSQNTAHECLTWRRCLYQFVPLLFNK